MIVNIKSEKLNSLLEREIECAIAHCKDISVSELHKLKDDYINCYIKALEKDNEDLKKQKEEFIRIKIDMENRIDEMEKTIELYNRIINILLKQLEDKNN